MTPSNPVSLFVTGSDTREFTYDPGPVPIPHYVIGRSEGYIHICAIVFARSEDHVREILRDMLSFTRRCNEEYAAYKRQVDSEDRHGFVDANARKLRTLTAVVDEHEGYTLSIGVADTHQMYKVGWASNDTI